MNTYNTYLNDFTTAWTNEQNNQAPLDTLRAMYKLYLFKQLATDSTLKKTDINKYFIREVFLIKGDIKKSPFKSCIYNKLTCLHYLIEKTNLSLSNKTDIDEVIEKTTEKTFKNINNFYDIMKKVNSKKTSKPKKEEAPKNEIPPMESNEGVGIESNKVVNITNNNPESIVDSMQLLDDLMNTTINHFEVCYKDNPQTALKKLIAFSESINQLVNKTSYTLKKVA